MLYRLIGNSKLSLGVSVRVNGFLGTIVVCGLPCWKVTAFIGSNIITAQVIWEGIWLNCVTQSTGQMQCKFYDSLLILPQDLQAARALVIISLVAGIFGILLNEIQKGKITIAAGIVFLLAGLLVLIPVCWSASTIIRDFYNPMLVEAQKRELGASLYIGWGSAGLLFLGGALLCSSCPPSEQEYYGQDIKYSKAQSVQSQKYV
uniref:Claudin 3 n=1 Tax=Oryzias sinensis TaxID=183150 RepID=A0A8C7X532_9TELE